LAFYLLEIKKEKITIFGFVNAVEVETLPLQVLTLLVDAPLLVSFQEL